MSQCDITPLSAFQSTNLSSKIDSFNRLSDRILRMLGYPFTNVEIHRDGLYESISIACEMFTKFAGYTREYLIFDSNLYDSTAGLRLDALFSLQQTVAAGGSLSTNVNVDNNQFTNYIQASSVYVSNSAIPVAYFSSISSLSSIYSDGIFSNEIISQSDYNTLYASNSTLGQYFNQSRQRQNNQLGTSVNASRYSNAFDYDIMDYRKVISVTDFEQGTTTGINTLFTIEQTLAQQTYFSYAMGNYGFDLISWYVLKDWLENREKLLAVQPSYDFNDRTQILRLYPQPKNGSRYYGIISCYVERPLRDIIMEQWVFQYSLALVKIIVGRVRGKYSGTQMFGGGTLNTDLLAEGLTEKEKLETQLFEGSPGFGDAEPSLFIVG